MRRLRHMYCFAIAGFLTTVLLSRAASLTWDGSGDMNWGPPPDATSWSGGTYNNGDTAVFAGAGTGTVTVHSNGVSPAAVIITNGSYSFAGGPITGTCGLTNTGSGTITIGQSYTGLLYTGETRFDAGILKINHNSTDTGISQRSLRGTLVLNGGMLRLQHTGAGHYNPDLTLTNPLQVTANGAVIDYAGAANDFSDNYIGPLTLGGDFTVSGITGNSGVRYNFLNTVTLAADVTITNATGPSYSHTVRLSPNISGATRVLSLEKAGSGTGFEIMGATASSIDLAALTVGTNGSLFLSPSASGINPLAQIKANGGSLTMSTNAGYSFQGTLAGDGPLYDPTAITWLGNGTLTFAQADGGNRDTFVHIISTNVVVGVTSGLTRLNAMPWRAYLTIDSPHALIVGDGGTLQWTAGSTVRETVRGNIRLLNGAILVGVNSGGNPGGLIRESGTLTLGDGTASAVTVRGNHGTDTDSFNIGFANNLVDSGNVTMKYANTSASAGTFFNVGWSIGGAYNTALSSFRETSGGTELAPLPGSGGVAIIGPASGTVATFTNAATLTTGGTVGFYNEINVNQRGAAGEMRITSTGVFTITNAGGRVQAATLTVDGGKVSGIGTFDMTDVLFTNGAIYEVLLTGSDPTNCGRVDASGALAFSAGTSIAIDTNNYLPQDNEYWYIGSGGTIPGLPGIPAGWSLENASGTLMLKKLVSATEAVIETRPASDVTATSATMNGFLHSTGTASTAVALYWGEIDKGDTSTGWEHTNDFGTRAMGPLVTNITTLVQDRCYYYRFRADNGSTVWDPEGGHSFITGDITVTGTTDGEEVGPVNGVFTLSRGSVLTNEDLFVYYTLSGSATEGIDYESVSGTATILQGQANATVNIVPILDPDVEGDETVWLSLLAGPYDSSSLASNSILILDKPGANLVWTDGAGTHAWNTNDANWSVGVATNFNGGDKVTFGGTAQGTITIATVGVAPGSTAVTNGSYTFAGGVIKGTGGLTKSGSGTLAVGQSYTGLVYIGNTRIDSGVLRIDHNSTDTGISDRSLKGNLILNGGTLRFNHTGASYQGPDLSFTNPMQVTTNGGVIDYAGGANDFSDNAIGPLILGGSLTVSGVTGNSGIRYNFMNAITLTTNAAITNATGPTYSHTVRLSPNISGSAYSLNLERSGNGTGFEIPGIGAGTIDIASLSLTAGSSLYISPTNTVDPFAQIKANGGFVTIGSGSALSFQGEGTAPGPSLDPTEFVWQGSNTLSIPLKPGGNGDTFLRIINSNLVVSSASGLTRFNAKPWRAYYTVDAPYAIIVGDGGTLEWTAGSQVRETLRGDIKFLNGAILICVNSSGNPGGLIRDTTGGGALTLGDGGSTIVTVKGNHGTDTDSFNIGFKNNLTDNGQVKMKYANTGSASNAVFNIGWSGGGAYNTALSAFAETSGGTEFAPLAGSGGIAVIGPDSGTVVVFTNTVTVSSGGPVGFYNEVNVNQRGTLGPAVFTNGASLTFATNGTVQAGDLTFHAGSELALTLYDDSAFEAGSLNVSGTLTFDAGVPLVVTRLPSVSNRGGPWVIGTFDSISGLPDTSGGYNVGLDGNNLVLDQLPAGTIFVLR